VVAQGCCHPSSGVALPRNPRRVQPHPSTVRHSLQLPPLRIFDVLRLKIFTHHGSGHQAGSIKINLQYSLPALVTCGSLKANLGRDYSGFMLQNLFGNHTKICSISVQCMENMHKCMHANTRHCSNSPRPTSSALHADITSFQIDFSESASQMSP
jgi:hypothetical protein